MKYLFICQGLPGSGKSFLAKQFSETFNAHICSAANFFVELGGGKYKFDATKIGNAHAQCQANAKENIEGGLNVIIDNTNTSLKEIQPYLDMVKDKGYDVYLVRPDTEWSHNIDELYIRNTHGVPKTSLEKMLDRLNHFESQTVDDVKVISRIEEVCK